MLLDLPYTSPKIRGVQSKYRIGDKIRAECILPVSHPPATLTWYINNDAPDSSSLTDQIIVNRSISTG